MRRDLGWLTAHPIAHRGLHDRAGGRPENSLAAFGAAVKAGYGVECDVHPSSDGVPMVFHDDDLRRLTGAEGCVRDRTAAELGSLRIHGTEERVPTLHETLEAVGGQVALLIELKHMPGRDGALAAAVVNALKGYRGPAALMSFEPALLADIAAAGPDLPRGLTAEGGWRAAPNHLGALRRTGFQFVSYAIDDLPTPAPVLLHRLLRLPLLCWTVRTPAQLAKARAWTDQITFEGFLP